MEKVKGVDCIVGIEDDGGNGKGEFVIFVFWMGEDIVVDDTAKMAKFLRAD